jgi:hypothetical protein
MGLNFYKVKNRLKIIKDRASSKNMECTLTLLELANMLQKDVCGYCGIDFTNEIHIDRKDNLKGYTNSNTIASCKICNTTKNSHFTYEEMKFIAESFYKQFKKRIGNCN